MTWQAFVANWIVNDYRAHAKRHGPLPKERWPMVVGWLRLWYLGVVESSHARRALREVLS